MISDYKPLGTYILDIDNICHRSILELNSLVHSGTQIDASNKVSTLTRSLFSSIVSTIIYNVSPSIEETLNKINSSDIHLSFPELNFINSSDFTKFNKIVTDIVVSIMEQILFHIPLTNNVELVLNQVTDSIIVLTLYGGVNGDF